MKPLVLRKRNAMNKRRAPASKVPAQQLITNPAPQAKIDALRSKEMELERILTIQQRSEELAKTTAELTNGIKMLTDDSKNVVDIIAKWDVVFGIMGVTDKREANSTEEWVRFVKPRDSPEPPSKKQKNV